MVSQTSVEKQLKAIGFNSQVFGKAEINELPNILLDNEKIFECVNGYYEGGFALLVATNLRVLLIDKKPLKFLTVEDLRFDMINQIDYSHRFFGAAINISTGVKNLRFRSYNQKRLRKLINHVQHRMAEIKMEQSSASETQQQHLEKINQQLQAYLLAQFKHQEELQRQLQESNNKDVQPAEPETLKPSPELADYLYAQGLLMQHQFNEQRTKPQEQEAPKQEAGGSTMQQDDIQDIVAAGRAEIFGKQAKRVLPHMGIEVNPLRIAYSKLPMMLRNRKFGRPSFHSHSQVQTPTTPTFNSSQYMPQ